ncbi:hypothetical protein L0664_13335 [Octadecabacter sp. G9-8]|uniref:DUF1311 domain-containing protein n=1 Tax=Octadecabacter dasysiphoniae TaxID=2909341 RepID=A0ABS9CXT5_9RHOB|nr:hypothetical protein [Octadecabacter dasysiphoniae]MCF2872052.1 hypothetical protein [Octadecabacter dasysiphoniae]
MRIFMSVLATAAALVATGAAAQSCSFRLSEFEAATYDYKADVSAFSDQLSTMFARFNDLSAGAQENPESCPAGLEQSRAAAVSLDVDALTARSDTLLDCAFFFNGRVLADIEAARAENDSQLILRLGEVQKRIFRIDVDVTDATKQAMFLGFRTQALVSEHDVLNRRCTLLGDIYD